MDTVPHADIEALENQLNTCEREAYALVSGLGAEQGIWRSRAGSWSVAECVDHLAAANRVYLRAMREPAARALDEGRWRRGPARPGLVGRWFVSTLEPPVKPVFRMKAPRLIQPGAAPALADAFAAFVASQDEVRAFLRAYAQIDLAGLRFPNPFLRGLSFSLATGLHVLTAHQRRHLWQAWNVRRAAEMAAA